MFKRGRLFCVATVFFVLCLMSVSWGEERASRKPAPDENESMTPLAVVAGAGRLVKAKFLADNTVVSNSSNAGWTNAFNTSVNLTGTSNQCVRLSYAGEIKIESTAAVDFIANVRALIDNVVLNGGSIGFQNVDIADPYVFSLTAMNWWICDVTPGSHTVRVQFGPFFAGDVAKVRERTLVIEYNQ